LLFFIENPNIFSIKADPRHRHDERSPNMYSNRLHTCIIGSLGPPRAVWGADAGTGRWAAAAAAAASTAAGTAVPATGTTGATVAGAPPAMPASVSGRPRASSNIGADQPGPDAQAPVPLCPWDLHTQSVAEALHAVSIEQIHHVTMRTSRGGRKRGGWRWRTCRPEILLARLMTHTSNLLVRAAQRSHAADITEAPAAVTALERAVKLHYLLPSLLHSADGRVSRETRADLLRRGELGRLVQ
jgi:hypothetical protein